MPRDDLASLGRRGKSWACKNLDIDVRMRLLLDNLSKASEEERAAAKEWCRSRAKETPVEKLRRGVRTIKMLNKLGGEGGPFGSEEEQKKRDEQKGKHGRKRRDADTLPELHSSISHRFDAVERSVVGLSTRLDRSVNDLKQRMDTSMGKVDGSLLSSRVGPSVLSSLVVVEGDGVDVVI